jgi:hypothetical protein
MQRVWKAVRSPDIFPLKTMDPLDRLLLSLRIVVVIFVLISLFDFKHSLVFLVLGIAINIILYYIQMKRTKEGYSFDSSGRRRTNLNSSCASEYISPKFAPPPSYGKPYNINKATVKYRLGDGPVRQSVPVPKHDVFCDDEGSLEYNSPNISLNQRLVGPANPKTKIPPIVIPMLNDFEYWRYNELNVPSNINEQSQIDVYNSGYAVSTCCGNPDGKRLVPVPEERFPATVGGWCPGGVEKGGSCDSRKSSIESYSSPKPAQQIPTIPMMPVQNPGVNVPFENLNYGNNPGRNMSGRRQFNENISASEYFSRSPTEGYGDSPLVDRNRPIESVRNKNRSEGFAPPTYGPDPNKEMYRSPKPAQQIPTIPEMRPSAQQSYNIEPDRRSDSREDYTYLETVPESDIESVSVVPNQPGWVNTMCGYNPQQLLDSNLPSNLPAGNCEKDPKMAQYNKNLFTQIIQPGVYTRSQIIEPISSNIGISFQQQFEPLTCSRDETGVHYLEHDPRIIEPAIYEPTTANLEVANTDNVYDPRFSGYGTSYRSYIEPVTGQARFMYDDINAIKMPNYIVRSKIDFLPYADSYGPMPPGNEAGNRFNPDIRLLAQDSWMRDSLQFRDDMMQRLMRKRNADQVQKRLGPKYTQNNRSRFGRAV